MALAHRETVEAEFFEQHGGVDHLVQPLGRRRLAAVNVGGGGDQVEPVETLDLHLRGAVAAQPLALVHRFVGRTQDGVGRDTRGG